MTTLAMLEPTNLLELLAVVGGIVWYLIQGVASETGSSVISTIASITSGKSNIDSRSQDGFTSDEEDDQDEDLSYDNLEDDEDDETFDDKDTEKTTVAASVKNKSETEFDSPYGLTENQTIGVRPPMAPLKARLALAPIRAMQPLAPMNAIRPRRNSTI